MSLLPIWAKRRKKEVASDSDQTDSEWRARLSGWLNVTKATPTECQMPPFFTRTVSHKHPVVSYLRHTALPGGRSGSRALLLLKVKPFCSLFSRAFKVPLGRQCSGWASVPILFLPTPVPSTWLIVAYPRPLPPGHLIKFSALMAILLKCVS